VTDNRKLVVELVGDASQLEKAFGKAIGTAKGFEAQMTAVGRRTEAVGKSMTRNVSAPVAALGVASVKMAQDFETTISRLVGLAGVSQKQANEWRKAVLDMAPVVGKAPQELAEGLYFIASSGIKGKAALDALTVSAKASAAGLGETQQVADAVTSAMNAYAKTGLTAAKAADVLTAAVREGKGEAAEFAPVIGLVVGSAAQLGVSFDQVGAALAAFTRLGVPASEAATQLSGIFNALIKSTPQAEKALHSVGLSGAELRNELREKGLLATLQTLSQAFDGNVTAMAKVFPKSAASAASSPSSANPPTTPKASSTGSRTRPGRSARHSRPRPTPTRSG
jgi:TP901 family phage tail tape measure protein